MTPFLIVLVVFVVVFVIFLMWGIGIYNSLRVKQITADGAWSDIDVQLKRRHDLVPNLVSTVKGYAAHEKTTLDAVISARTKAVGATSIKDRGIAEGELSQVLGRLMVLSEAYPDLKANQNFMALQEELTSTENKIGFARQHYNRCAGQYNESIVVFPALVVANAFGFKGREFFEIEVAGEREAPKVEF